MKRKYENHVPCVVDKSSTVPSENSNIESHEVFFCYYPDGKMNVQSGGFENHDAFKEYVHEMQEKKYMISLKVDFVADNEANNIRSACLLQFPYGVGDINEKCFFMMIHTVIKWILNYIKTFDEIIAKCTSKIYVSTYSIYHIV